MVNTRNTKSISVDIKECDMIDSIMRNTYGVLTNRCSIDDVLEQYKGKDAMFYGNPLDINDDDIQEVIEYFETTEEYEKCSELLELLKAKESAEFDMFIDNLASKNGITLY
jgi:malate/lactate dehydrogenase